jgi:prepilin-type N-terminal cleavage/methylation domain-containing protein
MKLAIQKRGDPENSGFEIAGGATEVMVLLTNRQKRGFTLIELMIVVVIIGLLAALAIPRFMAVSTKNKQAEAKLILKQIYVNQRAYRQAGNNYFIPAGAASATSPNEFKDITIEIASSALYTYTINATANTFTATATSGILDDDAALDVWQIDHGGNLICISDDSRL